jgi:starch synthase
VKIAFLASEAAPYAKTGGLADVAGSLPLELSRQGRDVAVFIPYYRNVKALGLPLIKVLEAHPLAWRGRTVPVTIWADPTTAYPVCFVENDEFFDRVFIYGTATGDYTDNGERYAFFAKAVLESLKVLPFEADILHVHDWQTAIALAYLKHVYAGDPFYAGMKSLFSIHNLAYQGLFPPDTLTRIGLPESLFRMEDLEFYGKVSYLKAGLLYASALGTVSPRYAREIQSPDFGCGLDGLLRRRAGDLTGILNGVDYKLWNPATDAAIPARYTKADPSGKAVCRKALLEAFGLPAPPAGAPIAGMVARLAGQKGLDLLIEAMSGLFAMGVKLVVLGTGDLAVQDALQSARDRFPSFLGLKIGFDEALARKIYAGSDLFLVPSRYEPCGLTQMISLKYGTIPVVRAVGGLDDSVEEFNESRGTGTGFKFEAFEPPAMIQAVRRAVHVYRQPRIWPALVKNAMTADFSWERSARAYLDLYDRIMSA